MSFSEDQVELNKIIGATVVDVQVIGSFMDDMTSVVEIRLSNGMLLSLSSQGFSDGSSALNVTVDS